VHLLRAGRSSQQLLCRSIGERVEAVGQPQVEALTALWRGDRDDDYGRRAVVATTTLALNLLRPELDMDCCQAQARDLWRARDRKRLA
jgi:hypothetical protein